MKSLTQILNEVKQKLNSIEGATFYHYRRPAKVKAEYGVWAEDGEQDPFNADNKKQKQQIHGTIDFYTLIENNPVIDDIQSALEELSAGAWALNSVQYEDETNLIHFEWDFLVV